MSFTIGQTLIVTTAFGTNLGTINGSGEFGVGGSFGFGWNGSEFGPHVNPRFTKKASIIDDMHGAPVGAMGLVIEHHARFTVGFSAWVLGAGVWADVRTAYGITAGSSIGAVATAGTHFVQCRGVGFGVSVRFGIGYSILQPVVDTINRFLSVLGVRARVTTSGGVRSDPRTNIIYEQEIDPANTKLCGTPGHIGQES